MGLEPKSRLSSFIWIWLDLAVFLFSLNYIFGKRKYFQVFCCIMKIVLENIFMCLVTFWKCYFPPPPTQNPPPHHKKTTKTPPPTPPQQQQKNQRSKRESKKSKSHKNPNRFMGRSKSHKKSKSQKEREIGSWVRRSIHRLAKSKAWSKGEDLERLVWGRWWSSVWLSLESTCCFECVWESSNGNCLKWKWERKLFYTLGPLFYGQHWKYFQFDPIFRTNQTVYFTEKHFWN